IRARCEGKVPVFTMSQGTRVTGPNRGMEAGPSGSNVHDKGDLCPWVLYVGKYKFTQNRWCRQAYKDLLWGAASATNVRDFEKCMLELKMMNPKSHEWEYCMKRIVNVQGVIDKCIGPLTPTATRIMESIKKEAHLMKVQWNRANKYQVSSSLGDQCVVDVVTMTCSCRK
ncbi:hypothetical protein Tco_0076361, partial [Tanacetum coccineum]